MLYETFKEKHGGKNLLKQAFLMSNLKLLYNISRTFLKYDPLLLQVKHYMKNFQIRSYLWSVFSCMRIEYGDLQSKSSYSIRIQENADQK